MKLKSLVLAAALAVPMLSASAATSGFLGNPMLFSSDPLAVGALAQRVSFSGLSAGLGDIFGAVNAQNVPFTAVEWDGKTWGSASYFGKGKPAASGVQDATGNSPATLVPESYAMFMAGLGLLGTIARRRMKAFDA